MNKLSKIQELFLGQAKKQKRRIGIGIIRTPQEVIDSLKRAKKYADLIVVGSEIKGFDYIPTKDDKEASYRLIELLKQEKIEGLVRGQLKDSYTHKAYLKAFNLPEPKYKLPATIIAKDNCWFVIPSASNYNAMILDSKIKEVERTAEWLKDLGIKPKIGITSTRRLTGRVGDFGLIEEIAKRCEETANYMRDKGYEVKEYYIDYENAVWERCNLIAPSIGMIGNTWLKGLIYLGGWTIVAIPLLDEGTYYDNTPRNNNDWFWPILSTVAWINREKLKL